MAITADTLKRLAQFDTPTICNVIELFDVRPRYAGFMNAQIKAAFPEMPPMVGFASTASFRAGAFPGKGDANGVTNIPINIATEVADISQAFVDAEKIVLDYVNGTGKKTPAGLSAARKEYGTVVAKLTDRVKK